MKFIYMIKYGELSLKKSNKKEFIRKLVDNLTKKCLGLDVQIKYDFSRIYIFFNIEELDKITDILEHTSGIYSYSLVKSCPRDLENILKTILEDFDGSSFKVETKRMDKKYPLTSMEISKKLGSMILNSMNSKVDVHNPEVRIKVEITKDYAYVYMKETKGLGGYPSGIQRKALAMLSGGIDSPVSAYLSLKKGIDLDLIYFESLPHTSLKARDKVIDLANKISEYSASTINLYIINFTALQEAIYREGREDYGVTMMRRYMYRIADQIAQKIKALAIINGESIGQVASQTLTSMNVINSVTSMPIIRPLACLDKEEIIAIAKKINTYDTSILPFDDCCTFFVPRHPIINPRLDICLAIESRYDFNTLMQRAIDSVMVIKIPKKKENLLEELNV